MTINIALLRGINVGGNNKIKMAELKRTLEEIGLARVQTYIMSGNILFESDDGEASLRNRIGQAIQESFGMSISVMLRTADEWEGIIADCPYKAESPEDGKSIHVSLLNETPEREFIDRKLGSADGIDEYRIQGREIYTYYRQSILESKLAKNLQKLGDLVTARNWNTITKLDELAREMKGEASR